MSPFVIGIKPVAQHTFSETFLSGLLDDREYLVLLKYQYSSKMLVGPADATAVAVIVISPVTLGIAIFPFE